MLDKAEGGGFVSDLLWVMWSLETNVLMGSHLRFADDTLIFLRCFMGNMVLSFFGFNGRCLEGRRIASLLVRSVWATLKWRNFEVHPSLLDGASSGKEIPEALRGVGEP
jgi:hypothetical protein